MPLNGDRLENVVSRWIDLKRKDGTIGSLYRHWIEGKSAEEKGPRWNVMTNVFGWGKDAAADVPVPARQAGVVLDQAVR